MVTLRGAGSFVRAFQDGGQTFFPPKVPLFREYSSRQCFHPLNQNHDTKKDFMCQFHSITICNALWGRS
jgi:hypothetical protein